LIKLEKGDEPDVLAKNAANWTNELANLVKDQQAASTYQKGRYNHLEVKAAVIAETHGKCAYCESKILHIDFGDIEHILPKKERTDLWFAWENLTLACSICNNTKRAYFDEELPLLDPYEDECEERLRFFGPLVRSAIGDSSAFMTERILELNREKLVERRTERMDQLRKLLEVVYSAPAALRAILIADFMKELANDKEYAAMARTLAKAEGIEYSSP
jgi:uncharacterized protein (TIGR02646 family)